MELSCCGYEVDFDEVAALLDFYIVHYVHFISVRRYDGRQVDCASSSMLVRRLLASILGVLSPNLMEIRSDVVKVDSCSSTE